MRASHHLRFGARLALELLDDPDRTYVASDFLRLEVLPKAKFQKNRQEALFYETFFDEASRVVVSSSRLIREAEIEAGKAGLSAVDALHVAAAKRARCVELVTAEKPTKPLFRAAGIQITSIRS